VRKTHHAKYSLLFYKAFFLSPASNHHKQNDQEDSACSLAGSLTKNNEQKSQKLAENHCQKSALIYRVYIYMDEEHTKLNPFPTLQKILFVV
jgi:hypothetical protein